MADEFAIKDSGARASFSGGMVRDITEGKASFLNVLFGPMLQRWAEHTTKGREKYPDVAPGTPNWTLAQGVEEYLRAKDSAFRHCIQWLRGDRDEDHASAVFFNINLAEYVLERCPEIRPSLGAFPEDTPPGSEELVSGLPNPHADEVTTPLDPLAIQRAVVFGPKPVTPKVKLTLSGGGASSPPNLPMPQNTQPAQVSDVAYVAKFGQGDRVKVIAADSEYHNRVGVVARSSDAEGWTKVCLGDIDQYFEPRDLARA